MEHVGRDQSVGTPMAAGSLAPFGRGLNERRHVKREGRHGLHFHDHGGGSQESGIVLALPFGSLSLRIASWA